MGLGLGPHSGRNSNSGPVACLWSLIYSNNFVSTYIVLLLSVININLPINSLIGTFPKCFPLYSLLYCGSLLVRPLRCKLQVHHASIWKVACLSCTRMCSLHSVTPDCVRKGASGLPMYAYSYHRLADNQAQQEGRTHCV